MADNARWYVVHTYSGYENAVKTTIEKFVVGRHLEDMIVDIQIPLEKVTEITDTGAAKEVERKVFPGYVLIKMVMTDDTWHLVRNVRGVTGFVGEASNKPIPLTEDEVLALGMEKHEVVVLYKVGDRVRINDGPWSPSPASWTRSTRRRTRSPWWCPCSAGRLPLSWSWTRWRSSATEPQEYQVSFPSKLLRRVSGCTWEGRPPEGQARHHHIISRRCLNMAQKVVGYVKLQIPAGKATPAPPVGPALGQHGVNIAAFTKEFNERTKNDMGMIIPVVITVYSDRSFSFVTKTPPAAVLIKKACNIESGSGVPNKTKVATISKADVQKIAETKMPDLNAASLEAAMSMIAGTARSMGVVVGE